MKKDGLIITTTKVKIYDYKEAYAGDHIGVNLKKLKAGVLQKGMLVVKPKSVIPTNYFEGTCYFLTKSEGGRSKPVLSGYIQMLFVDTWNIAFKLDIPKGIMIYVSLVWYSLFINKPLYFISFFITFIWTTQ